MPPSSSFQLPRIVLSSVVRSAYEGESHGGVYLVDLASGAIDQVLDWSDATIDWEGRGGDRGLRGIAFHRDRLFLAASDEIFVFDRDFRRRGSFGNRYLKHCHEICVAGDVLYITSTGYDSVLEYDLARSAFRRGYCLRFRPWWPKWRTRAKWNVRPRPHLTIFDPNGSNGPIRGDSSHINNVDFEDGVLYVSGTGLGHLWAISGSRLKATSRIPYGSHNARRFREGVLLNHTATDRIALVDRKGRVTKSFPLRSYPHEELINAGLPRDKARPAFGRGLAVVNEELVVGGSSPATITAYELASTRVVASINVTMDVRNSVHGLEVWPFDAS